MALLHLIHAYYFYFQLVFTDLGLEQVNTLFTFKIVLKTTQVWREKKLTGSANYPSLTRKKADR